MPKDKITYQKIATFGKLNPFAGNWPKYCTSDNSKMVVRFKNLAPKKDVFNVHVTWDSVLGCGASSGAVVFSGGVNGVLAQTIHVVDAGLTVSATNDQVEQAWVFFPRMKKRRKTQFSVLR